MNLEKLITKNFGVKLLNKLIITYPELDNFNSNMSTKIRKQSYPGTINNTINSDHNFTNIPENFQTNFNGRNVEYSYVNMNSYTDKNYAQNSIMINNLNNINNVNNGNFTKKNVNKNNPYLNFYS